jgi:hypothetical protein
MKPKSLFGTKQDYSLLRETPFANTLTTNFALKLIEKEKLGKDDITDYISNTDLRPRHTIDSNPMLLGSELDYRSQSIVDTMNMMKKHDNSPYVAFPYDAKNKRSNVGDTMLGLGFERVANLISSKKFGDYFKWRYSVTNVDFELDSIQFEQRVNRFLSSAQLPITPELAQSNDSKDPLARAGSSLIVAGLMPLVSGLVSATSSDPETTAALLITSGVISTVAIIRAGIMLQKASQKNNRSTSERSISITPDSIP